MNTKQRIEEKIESYLNEGSKITAKTNDKETKEFVEKHKNN